MKTKSSKNYEWFKFYSNNRPISRIHLNNLRKQFEKYGNITEISPITVNPNGFIMDGQHRRIYVKSLITLYSTMRTIRIKN
jgi:2-iminoacetate synthase ThiH